MHAVAVVVGMKIATRRNYAELHSKLNERVLYIEFV